jgi:hypothetical protein
MKFRTLLLGLSALFVAFNAAFFSVSGLSKLFAGATFSVMLMASSLEIAKLITAGYLYNYWEKINKVFRWYLVTGVVILVLITSLGIYGFLTSAFQDTFNQFSVNEKEKTFLQQKEKFYSDDVARYDEELERISNNISTLSNAKSQSIQVRDTSVVGGVRTTISTAELRLAQSRINVEEENRKGVQAKREVAADSLQSIQLKILDLDTNLEGASELGPLQYLSGLTGYGMDKIINWLILIIIFVFDPLAVALVVAFNNAIKVDSGIVKKEKIIRKRELYDETPDEEESTIMESDSETVLDEEWDNTLQDGLEDIVSEEEVMAELEKEDKEPTIEEIQNEVKKQKPLTKKEVEKRIEYMGEPLMRAVKEKGRINGKPYYLHQSFDWRVTKLWQNDPEAVRYWMNNKHNTNYPTDFNTKTY